MSTASKSTQHVTKEELDKAIKELQAALEAGMYGVSTPKSKLLSVLDKFGVKSARRQLLTVGGALQMESLEHALDAARYSFGKPDSLLIDSKQLDKFKKLKRQLCLTHYITSGKGPLRLLK